MTLFVVENSRPHLNEGRAHFREEPGAGSDGSRATAEPQPGKERSARCRIAASARPGDIDRDFPEKIVIGPYKTYATYIGKVSARV